LEEDLAGAEETASAAALPSSAAWWKKMAKTMGKYRKMVF
jgi:hypothetical protein